jgi:hypothetical protein
MTQPVKITVQRYRPKLLANSKGRQRVCTALRLRSFGGPFGFQLRSDLLSERFSLLRGERFPLFSRSLRGGAGLSPDFLPSCYLSWSECLFSHPVHLSGLLERAAAWTRDTLPISALGHSKRFAGSGKV